MALFRKKPVALRAHPDQWTVAQGTMNGEPLILRLLDWAAENLGHPDYPYQVGIALSITGEYAPPTPPDTDRLSRFEDDLVPHLTTLTNEKLEAIHAGVVTMPHMREFIFYTSDPKATETKIKTIQARNTDLVVQFIIQHDPKWRILKEMLP